MSEDRRDREGTKAHIVSAAYDLLATSHHTLPGVNAIARQAGCDKQLIYRYFDGLDGVLAAVGAAAGQRFASALVLQVPGEVTSYGQLVQALLSGLIALYRADPSLAGIKRSEMVLGAALAGLASARAQAINDWLAPKVQAIALAANPALDRAAINALLIGAVESAVLASYGQGKFAGMPLQGDTDWARLERALGQTIALIYGPT
jgi:AcrR family transcriptional regulator